MVGWGLTTPAAPRNSMARERIRRPARPRRKTAEPRGRNHGAGIDGTARPIVSSPTWCVGCALPKESLLRPLLGFVLPHSNHGPTGFDERRIVALIPQHVIEQLGSPPLSIRLGLARVFEDTCRTSAVTFRSPRARSYASLLNNQSIRALSASLTALACRMRSSPTTSSRPANGPPERSWLVTKQRHDLFQSRGRPVPPGHHGEGVNRESAERQQARCLLLQLATLSFLVPAIGL